MATTVKKQRIRWTQNERYGIGVALAQHIDRLGKTADSVVMADIGQCLTTRVQKVALMPDRLRTSFGSEELKTFLHVVQDHLRAWQHQEKDSAAADEAFEVDDITVQNKEKDAAYFASEVWPNPEKNTFSEKELNRFMNRYWELAQRFEAYRSEYGGDPIADALNARRMFSPSPSPSPTPSVPPKPKLPPRIKVVIAGVHEKHWDQLVKDHQRHDLVFIPQNATAKQILAKGSGRSIVIFKQGVNGEVLRLLHRIAETGCWFEVTGMTHMSAAINRVGR